MRSFFNGGNGNAKAKKIYSFKIYGKGFKI